MEFFRELDSACDAAHLQRHLSIANLPRFCREISEVLNENGETGEIYCLWGCFQVHRECIKGGVRFTLVDCPNVLAWTVTSGLPPQPAQTVVHCTINRRAHDPDFIESIDLFVDEWKMGLERFLKDGIPDPQRTV